MRKTPKPPKKPAPPPRRTYPDSSSGPHQPPPHIQRTPSAREVRLLQWLWRAENPHER